jgi:hypothetical protein
MSEQIQPSAPESRSIRLERPGISELSRGEDQRLDKLTSSTNFLLWKHKVLCHIKSRYLLPILEQTYPRPTDESSKIDTEVCEARTMSIICNALDEHHHLSVIHCKTSKEIWETLTCIRESNSSISRLQLRRELTNFKYKENQNLSEYLSGLNVIVDKLRTAHITIDDEEIISKILDELPKQFDAFQLHYLITANQSGGRKSLIEFTKNLDKAEKTIKRQSKKIQGNEAFITAKKTVTCFDCGRKGYVKSEYKSSQRINKNRS